MTRTDGLRAAQLSENSVRFLQTFAIMASVVEPLLIYGVASLASRAAKSLLHLEDDYGLSHVAGHGLHEAVVDGVNKLRETFTIHTPERNHDLMEALQRSLGWRDQEDHIVIKVIQRRLKTAKQTPA
jgi:hypothetical protein